jgi:hypothetical protein
MQFGDVGRGRAAVGWCGLCCRESDREADGTCDSEYACEMHRHNDPHCMVFATRTDGGWRGAHFTDVIGERGSSSRCNLEALRELHRKPG